MAIQMTRAEYEAKYGSPPAAPPAPVKMTRAQYDAKYGSTEPKTQSMGQRIGSAVERAGAFVSRNNILGSKIGENIGTQFAALKHGIKTGDFDTAQQISKSAPTTKQLAGDVARSAALPVSIMTPNPATLGRAASQFAKLGATSGASEAMTENQDALGVAKGALKGGVIGAATGGFAKAVEKGITKLGAAAGSGGEKIIQTILKPLKADVEDGFKVDTIRKYGLGGSLKAMHEKTDHLMDDLMRQLTEKTEQGVSHNLNEAFEATAAILKGDKLKNFGSNTAMEGALDQLKAEIAALPGGGIVSNPQAQTVKRAAGHFGAWLYGAADPGSTARQRVYNAFYRQLKTDIEKNSPEGVREINQQLSELIPVMNALIRRIPVAQRNSTFSLTDIITMSASVLEPRALSVSALNVASKSGTVGAALMKLSDPIKKRSAAFTPALRVGATALPQALGSSTPPSPPQR